MRVRAATAPMHAHTHVILAIASHRKGSQETRTRAVVLPGLCFAGGKQTKTRAVFISGQCFGAGEGSPKKNPAHNLSGHLLRRAMNTGNCTSKRIIIDRRMGRIIDMHIRMSTSTNTHMNNDGVLPGHTELPPPDSNPGRSGEGRVS